MISLEHVNSRGMELSCGSVGSIEAKMRVVLNAHLDQMHLNKFYH